MIVVAGEALIDRIQLPDGRVIDVPGGGPYNTARTIGRLGGRVCFMGRLSNDDSGVLLRSRLVADGVEMELVVRTDDPTPIASARIDAEGVATYKFRLDGSAAAGLVPGDLRGGLPPETIAIHVGTLGLVVEPMATTIETLVRSVGEGVLVMLDLNCRPSAIADPAAYLARIDRVLARTDIVKASVEDLAYLRPAISPLQAARGLLSPGTQAARGVLSPGTQAVLLTDGGGPVRIVSVEGVDELPIPTMQIVDTVGAGDAFGGGFLSAWIGAGHRREEVVQREALIAATNFAIAVAGLTTTRAGAEPPTAAEVTELAGRS
jgi:fructokinase